MRASCTIICHTEANTAALGAELSRWVLAALMPEQPFAVHLSGPVGAGKSSLCRAFLRSLGVQGAIKSPSYALMEVYNLLNCLVYHFDLYRLSGPADLLEYGLLEPMVSNTQPNAVCLVEWPEQAQGVLPQPHLHVKLDFAPAVQAGQPCGQSRTLVLQGFGSRGCAVVAGCQAWAQGSL